MHAGWHVIAQETLRYLGQTGGGSGLILGVDQQRRPVPVRFFRPEPTKVTLVGGVWLQRLLAFRALAVGARIVVMTSDPGAWHGFGEWATGRADRLALWNDPRPPVVLGSPQQPTLVIQDTGAYSTGPAPEPRPWQTQLTVLRQLSADNVRTLHDSSLVVMQRLTEPEAGLAVPALGLPDRSGQLLQVMGEDMLALLGGGADRYVWITPTDIERQYHGAPRR